MHRRRFLSSIGVTLLAGCAQQDQTTSPEATTTTQPPEATTTEGLPEDRPIRGVSFSPRSFDRPEYQAFFDHLESTELAVRWAGPWVDLGEDGAPTGITNEARARGIVPIIDTGVYSVGERALFQPLTQETIAAYLDDATTFAEQHQPPFLGLGTEVNIHAEDQPDEFDTYLSLFTEATGAIREVSPDTRVYVSFQLEWMMGLRGGRFGGTNDPSVAQWDLLDRFTDADLVGLTTYPGLVYPDPADIPDDHYAPIADRADKPLAIVETGWSHTGTDDLAPEWESTEAEQAAFARRLTDLTADLDLALLVWLNMYKLPGVGPPFDTYSLRRADGTARPAWDAWASAQD